jgi:AcrR family transcriptional regulator
MPNPVRSARTREKLMRATIECLFELGYDRTSTVLVSKRAAVSRGAMLHQFPSKADLMMAASEYIRIQRRDAHTAALEGIDDPLEKLRRMVDITWSELAKPSGVARIEIMLASRSDKAFGARFSELNADLDRRHKAWMWRLAQEAGIKDRPAIEAMTTFYTAALRGLAIDLLQPGSRGSVAAAVDLLRDYQSQRLEALIRTARR